MRSDRRWLAVAAVIVAVIVIDSRRRIINDQRQRARPRYVILPR